MTNAWWYKHGNLTNYVFIIYDVNSLGNLCACVLYYKPGKSMLLSSEYHIFIPSNFFNWAGEGVGESDSVIF